MILVTGAAGSIGVRVCEALSGKTFLATDVDSMDVTNLLQVTQVVKGFAPKRILHLAGAKHAPEGEFDPEETARVNITGTANVLRAAASVGARVVTASTCKACDPETAYGATKLIAERMTLNAGGVVIRFFNVPEASGNVFRLWESLSEDEPLPVTSAYRYFMPMEKAVRLCVSALELESGRYTLNPGEAKWMPEVARRLYPRREQARIPLRRGDRFREPLKALCESAAPVTDDLMRITSPYDHLAVEGLRVAA